MSDFMPVPSPSPEPSAEPSTKPEEHKGLWGHIADVADFLFATKSLGRILTGEGSWGDLGMVGITAASFFIPPVRLLKFGAKPLESVIAHAAEVVASDTASVTAKRMATTTAENARYLLENPEKHKELVKLAGSTDNTEITKLNNLSTEADYFLSTGSVPREHMAPTSSYPENVAAAQTNQVPGATKPKGGWKEGSEPVGGKNPNNDEIDKINNISNAVKAEEGNYTKNQYDYISDEEFDILTKEGVTPEYLEQLNNIKREAAMHSELPEGSLVIDDKAPITDPRIVTKADAVDVVPEKNLYDMLRKDMPAESKATSAIGPEIDSLTNEIDILNNFRAIDIGDTQQTAKIVRVFEQMIEKEPEEAVRKRMTALVEDIKTHDANSDFFKKVKETLLSKQSRLDALVNASGDKSNSYLLSQGENFIPVIKANGKITYVKPRVYNDKPGGLTAYDLIESGGSPSRIPFSPERSTLKELKMDEKRIMDKLEFEKDPAVRAKWRGYLADTRKDIQAQEFRLSREHILNQDNKKLSSSMTQRIFKEDRKRIEGAVFYGQSLVKAIEDGLGSSSKEINRQLSIMKSIRVYIPAGRKDILREFDQTVSRLTKLRDTGKYRVTKPITSLDRNEETLAKVQAMAKPESEKELITNLQHSILDDYYTDPNRILTKEDLKDIELRDAEIKKLQTEAVSGLSREERMAATKAKVDALAKTKPAEIVEKKAIGGTGDVVRWSKLTTAEQKDVVYIGRGSGDKGKFGNPFPVGNGVTVKESVNKYSSWLWEKIKSDPDYATELHALKGKRLACPGSEPNDACHGQVILKAIKYLDDNPELMSKSVAKPSSDIVVHSGLAAGADTAWAKAADEAGIKTVGHSFKGHSGPGTRPKLEVRNELSESQLKEADVHLKKANEVLGRPTGNMSEFVRNLLRRNYYQIKDSEAVIAVSKILPGGKIVDGGTGWAVQMGIDMDKAVYVFDQEVNAWAKWNGESFIKSDLPPNFKSFAGIGSRNLKPSGRKAIQDYIESLVKGK